MEPFRWVKYRAILGAIMHGPIARGWAGTKGPSWVPVWAVVVSDGVVLA